MFILKLSLDFQLVEAEAENQKKKRHIDALEKSLQKQSEDLDAYVVFICLLVVHIFLENIWMERVIVLVYGPCSIFGPPMITVLK